MRDVVEHYGAKVGRAGFIPCPFHQEKTGSLKIYSKSYHCFGCGANGDVIAYVMALFGIDFKAALMRLNVDFCLGLARPSKRDQDKAERYARQRRAEKKQREQEEKECRDQLNRLSEEHRRLWGIVVNDAPRSENSTLSKNWVLAIHKIEWIEHKIERLLNQKAG